MTLLKLKTLDTDPVVLGHGYTLELAEELFSKYPYLGPTPDLLKQSPRDPGPGYA